MVISVIFSADIPKDMKPGDVGPSGIEAVDKWSAIPSGDKRHKCLSRTMSVTEFLELIKKYELYTIDDLGPNYAVRLSSTGPIPINVYAIAEPNKAIFTKGNEEMIEDRHQETSEDLAERDQENANVAWMTILKATDQGARKLAKQLADKTPAK